MELRTKMWRGGWMALAAVGIVAVIASLVSPRRSQSAVERPVPAPAQTVEAIRVTGPRQISISAETPLALHLSMVEVREEQVTYPLLTVTGSIVARIRPGTEPLEGRWQFASPEVATNYSDWVKTRADIEFNETQLKTTRELTQAQIDRYQSIVDHLAPLVPQGGVPGKEIRTAEADLVQAKLQGQKDVFSAETALRLAVRQRTALESQLAQAGIEPSVLSQAREGVVLISANVPEAKISQVRDGQSCDAKFYSFHDRVFLAHVEKLGSVLSTQRRTLRVLFDLTDLNDELKPGMFAEVDLGTDPRPAMLIPADCVLHLGRADYVFVQQSDKQLYDLVEVQVSEARGQAVEALRGLKPGDRVVSAETVLLKPLAIQSLAL